MRSWDMAEARFISCFLGVCLTIAFIAYEIADTSKLYDSKIDKVDRHYYKLQFEDGKVITRVIDDVYR